MANRMAVSFYKYGKLADAYPHKVSAVDSLKARLKLYLEGGMVKGENILPGNTEYLMDVANFAMIEFLRPSVAQASFVATDSSGSPGRVWNDGQQRHQGNNP